MSRARMRGLRVSKSVEKGKRVIVLIDETTVTVVHLDSGEVIATQTVTETKNYWRNKQTAPGRWPTAEKQ